MYNERKDSFSIKDLIVQLLFIVLFVFILVWLFPTKNSLEGKSNGLDNTKFDVLTNRIFNENLQTMKEAAISYYTNSRLPKNVNDVESMTLRKMLKEKLLIEFKDANNKSCDLDGSYVEITKLEDEYLLKVNLSCTDNDAYILVHLGCYDYCRTDVCENKDAKPSKPIENVKPTPTPTPTPNPTPNPNPTPTPTPTPNPNPNPDPTPDPEPETPKPVCSYKYQKVVSNSVWSDWSEWSLEKVTETDSRKVDTKEESKTETKEVLVRYEDKTYYDMDKPIYDMIQVKTSEVSVQYCKAYTTQYTSTGQKKYEWIDQGTSYYTTHPKDSIDTKYVYVGSTPVDCGNCSNGVLYIYRKYTLKIYDVVTKEQVCTSIGTLTQPIFISVPDIVGYETYTKKVPVYETQTITTTTKYYRYKTLSTTYNTLTEWSSVENDQKLISQGYKYITKVCK